MKLIKELTEKDVGAGNGREDFDVPYKLRKAARAIVFNPKTGKIALEFDAKHNHHKIPGGGVDEGEDIIHALKREVREEAGCDIEIIDEIGIIIEYRNQLPQLQISYCWLVKVIGEIGQPTFDEEEKEWGFESKWVSPKEAFELFKNDKPKGYTGYFMHERDLLFLENVDFQKLL